MPNHKTQLSRFDKSSLFFYDERLDTTPSRLEKIPFKHEIYFRQKTASFICYICDQLRCNLLVRASALCAMNRYYMRRSISSLRKESVASSCVLLASKYEDRTRLLQDVARVQYGYVKATLTANKMSEETIIRLISKEIVRVEVAVIVALDKDMTFLHPHYFVGKLYDQLKLQHRRDTFKVAIQLANTSMAITFFPVQFEPAVVACACLYLASYHVEDQSMLTLVAEISPKWTNSEDKSEYKHVARRLHKIIQATPEQIKRYVGFTLTGPLFAPVNQPPVQEPNAQSESVTPSSTESAINANSAQRNQVSGEPKRVRNDNQSLNSFKQ